ncbi:MAG: VanZ family protein [Marinobacter sp.]|uniref:VanZ family protein n=1 Tax=Marinobacter sp. TaxID=50741 RepID=UPI001B4BD927|nr:VanZ family protein [Marinobacter sp.]MBQ0748274.1 VanZ family protein [Marinobacter sp.]MBQ0812808.1 VanZ family protein [Marinobacter sp.]|tara:strand:+ start:23164 stop:23568 length:405 start_codon:yes stop_codon:yes gene_type:complete
MATLKHQLTTLLHFRPLWRFAFLISVVAIGFLATTSSSYPIPSAPSDKVNHLIAFIELTILTRLAWPELRSIWYAPALLAFGLGIEIVQATLPYRDFSLADVAADGAGILIGLLPWPGLRKAARRNLSDSPESV